MTMDGRLSFPEKVRSGRNNLTYLFQSRVSFLSEKNQKSFVVSFCVHVILCMHANTTSSHGNVRCQGEVYARTDPRTYEETHGIFSQAAIYLVSSLIFLPGTFSYITEARSISLDGTVNAFAPAFLLIDIYIYIYTYT